MARILHLFRAPKRHAPREELATARAVENSGLAGRAHARPGGKRQVLLVEVKTLGSLNLVPGIIHENITTQGLDVHGLQVGQRLRMGSVVLEVSAVCEPCEAMDAIRPGLLQRMFTSSFWSKPRSVMQLTGFCLRFCRHAYIDFI